MQWFRTIGNCDKLTMTFQHQGETVILQGGRKLTSPLQVYGNLKPDKVNICCCQFKLLILFNIKRGGQFRFNSYTIESNG